jgi:hypothetical protein
MNGKRKAYSQAELARLRLVTTGLQEEDRRFRHYLGQIASFEVDLKKAASFSREGHFERACSSYRLIAERAVEIARKTLEGHGEDDDGFRNDES